MTERRIFHINRLGAKLTLYALISVCAALGAFFAGQAGAYWFLDKKSGDAEFETRQNLRTVAEVQRYVDDNELSLSGSEGLWSIPGANTTFLIMIYRDGELEDEAGSTGYRLTADELDHIYPITFSDGALDVYIWNFGYLSYYYRVSDVLCGLLAFLTFASLFVFLIRKKLRYILKLEQELEILEGGDLSHAITVQGSDELGSLARGIDDMRRSFIERQEGEAEAIRANQALVTAMSHDLRTPLTSLLGYIELIQNAQYDSEEQLGYFISASRDKVYRIKEMTDALFEYALCSGSEAPAQLRALDAYELFSQLITEHGFELESAGFRTELNLETFHAGVQADPSRLARVFDNLSSNLKKYADPAFPVRIELSLAHVWVKICVDNRIAPRSTAESTRIGLKTCERILQQHNGRFAAECDGNTFRVIMELPVWDSHE